MLPASRLGKSARWRDPPPANARPCAARSRRRSRRRAGTSPSMARPRRSASSSARRGRRHHLVDGRVLGRCRSSRTRGIATRGSSINRLFALSAVGHRDFGQFAAFRFHHQPAVGKISRPPFIVWKGSHSIIRKKLDTSLNEGCTTDDLDCRPHHVGGGIDGAETTEPSAWPRDRPSGWRRRGASWISCVALRRGSCLFCRAARRVRRRTRGRVRRSRDRSTSMPARSICSRAAASRMRAARRPARCGRCPRACALRRLQHARVLGLAQHDAHGRRAGVLDDAVDRFHGYVGGEWAERNRPEARERFRPGFVSQRRRPAQT